MVALVFCTAPNSGASLSLIFFLMREDRGQGVGPKTEMLGSTVRLCFKKHSYQTPCVDNCLCLTPSPQLRAVSDADSQLKRTNGCASKSSLSSYFFSTDT